MESLEVIRRDYRKNSLANTNQAVCYVQSDEEDNTENQENWHLPPDQTCSILRGDSEILKVKLEYSVLSCSPERKYLYLKMTI